MKGKTLMIAGAALAGLFLIFGGEGLFGGGISGGGGGKKATAITGLAGTLPETTPETTPGTTNTSPLIYNPFNQPEPQPQVTYDEPSFAEKVFAAIGQSGTTASGVPFERAVQGDTIYTQYGGGPIFETTDISSVKKQQVEQAPRELWSGNTLLQSGTKYTPTTGAKKDVVVTLLSSGGAEYTTTGTSYVIQTPSGGSAVVKGSDYGTSVGSGTKKDVYNSITNTWHS